MIIIKNISNEFQKKINLLNFNLDQMKKFFISIGEKEFRAIQIMQWIYQYYCDDFTKMTNINDKLKKKLLLLCCISPPYFFNKKISIDGTIKWNVAINKKSVETVYIPKDNRITLCISSQLGCPLSCNFCATGRQKFVKNLNVYEIIGQIWYIGKLIYLGKFKNVKSITNIVMMGMGEPLLNFNNVVTALQIMLNPFGFNFSKNRVTVSTSGIVPAIKKLYKKVDVSLAISLHAPNNNIRNQLMPINYKYDIQSLLISVKQYLKNTHANKSRVTIEYVMLNKINDQLNHAIELSKLLQSIPHKINLIPWNSFKNCSYTCSDTITINQFSRTLINKGCIVTIRAIRGSDINAACGQLVGRIINL